MSGIYKNPGRANLRGFVFQSITQPGLGVQLRVLGVAGQPGLPRASACQLRDGRRTRLLMSGEHVYVAVLALRHRASCRTLIALGGEPPQCGVASKVLATWVAVDDSGLHTYSYADG